ncbi:unnamed protein product [marine sediment metagenome]|uniref:DNA-directed DNA polymerase n=1 Tax=marine sediment metagenome TaxID=412755 RepID=X1VFF7_9ZZZZ
MLLINYVPVGTLYVVRKNSVTSTFSSIDSFGEPDYKSFYVLDVNSLYPFVMRNNEYPVKYICKLPKSTIKELTEYIKIKAVVARVLIETNKPVYAVNRDRTLFPIGVFETVLTTLQIHGHVLTQKHQ